MHPIKSKNNVILSEWRQCTTTTLAPHVNCLAIHAGENPSDLEPVWPKSLETLRYTQGDRILYVLVRKE
jgi:hypothetical protein